MKVFYGFFIVLFLSACGSDSKNTSNNTEEENVVAADVKEVTVQGKKGSYTFSVTLKSDDKGCNQYANWWEVLNADHELVYRRVLGHSHTNEQPFERSGGPVSIQEDDTVFIRAHMHPQGYSGDVFKGSVKEGFSKLDIPPAFSQEIENEEPLPSGCAF